MTSGSSSRALALLLGIPWRKIGGWLNKAKLWLVALMKPLGAFGIFGLALIDSSSMPLPFLDPLIVSYGVADHSRMLLYCVMAAVGAALGSMVPYYLGRAGGELFLLKRINRERYERLRDRFEKQEFLAIMLPAMCPPPMPVKIFELAAGVFEMRPVMYFLAIAAGKFLRYLIESVLVILYGPAILHSGMDLAHRHAGVLIGVVVLLLVLIILYMVRRIFDRRRGVLLPVEEPAGTALPDPGPGEPL